MNAKQEIITRHEAEAPAIHTPMDMLNHAVANGASIDILTKLMDLQERHEKNQARRAFEEAIALAKAEIKPVTKNATGNNEKRYANFAAYAQAVDPILSKHGLSYRFRSAQTDRINVTCILSHRAGHSEENTLGGPADDSGKKNAIQAIGSTLTYLQRYSLVQALGLAAADDDDGKAADLKLLSKEQVEALSALIDELEADIVKVCEHWKVGALAEIPAGKYDQIVQGLRAWRAAEDRRKSGART